MGRILGRFGTDVGTDKTRKIPNVYRPWDGGTDKLGGRRGRLQEPAFAERLPLSLGSFGLRRGYGPTRWRDKPARQAKWRSRLRSEATPSKVKNKVLWNGLDRVGTVKI